ncbi:TolC family protein [Echinicola strongylocentroti]|uniref:TolC family protein n=1 Tax=Echinicola strongylocentroti TaxID=1795355 RepID=A0A2Z4IGU6_9BACT|nr:TolC family protein [Echinicola strongylocentroti]AWW30381.1 TolC family protein [Echinicola strongylocentroti]
MRKQCLVVLSMVAAVFSAYGQDELSFEQAIMMGLENNYDVKIALKDNELTEIDKKLGVGALLPSLDATYGRTTSTEDVEQQFVNESVPKNIDGAKSSGENFNINAIYGFRYEAVVALKRLGKLNEIGELQAKVVIENTVAAISEAYYRLAAELKRHEVLQETLELSQQRLDIAKSQYELGGSSKTEFLAAQVDYNTDMSLLVSQEQIIRTARINLNELMALDEEKEFEVTDSIKINQDLKLGPLVDQAMDQNKMLLINRRQENVAYLQLKEIQAQRLPYLSLDGNYRQSVSNSDAGFLIQNKREGYSFGATIGINLFSGFTLNRQIQRARVQQESQAYLLDQYEVQLKSDIYRAFNIYENSKRRLHIERQNYQVVEENTAIAFDRFKTGLTSYLEFRDAQVNRLNAESRLIDAVFSTKVAEVELMRLAGKIYYKSNGEDILN